MDIRFLKGLTPNVGYLFYKNHINLLPTPCLDIISVGIGQIIRNHSIYVPIHGLNSPYHTKKVTNQEGGSNSVLQKDRSEEKESNVDAQTIQQGGKNVSKEGKSNDLNTLDKAVDNELIKLNGQKRKINDSVLASFQNPIIKTKTLQIGGEKKLNSKNTFKFRIID